MCFASEDKNDGTLKSQSQFQKIYLMFPNNLSLLLRITLDGISRSTWLYKINRKRKKYKELIEVKESQLTTTFECKKMTHT